MSIADEIDRLDAQRAAGRLTDAEFAAAKARLFAEPEPIDPARLGWQSLAADTQDRVEKLRRSLSDRWVGGVCGGIARMIGVESWIVRLTFVIALLFGGFGLLPYVLLWIFVPLEGR
jgi:phage shock protein PspC (stress-responsive transcriptional regulator)